MNDIIDAHIARPYWHITLVKLPNIECEQLALFARSTRFKLLFRRVIVPHASPTGLTIWSLLRAMLWNKSNVHTIFRKGMFRLLSLPNTYLLNAMYLLIFILLSFKVVTQRCMGSGSIWHILGEQWPCASRRKTLTRRLSMTHSCTIRWLLLTFLMMLQCWVPQLVVTPHALLSTVPLVLERDMNGVVLTSSPHLVLDGDESSIAAPCFQNILRQIEVMTAAE